MLKAHDINPVLILIRGLPGSGKSYLAKALYNALEKDTVVMLDPDATDYKSVAYKEHVQQLTAEGVDPKLHAYRFLRAQAYRGIETGKIILWNQPFTNLEIFQKMIDRLQTHAAEYNRNLSICIVEVEVDPATANERVQKRKQSGGHGPSEATFLRFANDYASFAHLGFETVHIDGNTDVQASVATILKTLHTLSSGASSAH